jgi:hypothetical protein
MLFVSNKDDFHQWYLLPRIAIFFNLTVRSSKSNDPKIKILKMKSHGLPSPLSSVSYIKDRWETNREKDER